MLTLALVLCLSMACAEDVRTSGDWEYVVQENGTAKLVKYHGGEEYLKLPEVLDGYAVTAIGKSVLYHTPVNTVEIPNCITVTEANPFYDADIANIIVMDDHPVFEVHDGVLYSKPDARLIAYPREKTDEVYTVLEGTRTISA